MPDELLPKIQFTFPWQYNTTDVIVEVAKDSDGFPIQVGTKKGDPKVTREFLQKECWNKFHRNPQINTSVRGLTGRLTGCGYETTSGIEKIQDAIEERFRKYYTVSLGNYAVQKEYFPKEELIVTKMS